MNGFRTRKIAELQADAVTQRDLLGLILDKAKGKAERGRSIAYEQAIARVYLKQMMSDLELAHQYAANRWAYGDFGQ